MTGENDVFKSIERRERFALYERAIHSLRKSDSLALLKSNSLALLKSDSLQIRSFHPAFPIFMTETNCSSSLFSLFVKEDIRYRRSFKKSDENESLEKSQIWKLLHFEFINDSNHVNL